MNESTVEFDQKCIDSLNQKGWHTASNLAEAINDLIRGSKKLIIDVGGEGDRAIELLKDPNLGVITINKSPDRIFFWRRTIGGGKIPTCPDSQRQRLVVGDAGKCFFSLPEGSLEADVEISSLCEEVSTDVGIDSFSNDQSAYKALANFSLQDVMSYYLRLLFSIIRSLAAGSSITILEPQQLIHNLKKALEGYPGLTIEVKKRPLMKLKELITILMEKIGI